MAGDRSGTRPTLSVALITRNEGCALPLALDSVAGIAAETVVVDTGSTDDTVAIARARGARVIESPWQEDFSLARNISLDAATGDWVLCLDADEILAPGQKSKVRRLLSGRADAFYVRIRSPLAGRQDGQVFVHAFQRLFRNRKEYRFQGRVHEQIYPSLAAHGARIEFSDLVIEHAGYRGDEATRRAKLERNRRLLLRDLGDRPEDSLAHFHLGETCALLGEPLEALAAYDRALELGTLPPHHCAAALQNGASALLRLGRWEEARARAGEALAVDPDMRAALLVQGSAGCRSGRYEDGIRATTRYLDTADPPSAGGTMLSLEPDRPRAFRIRGECYLQVGRLAEAEADAERVIRERPSWAGGHRLMARVLVAAGDAARAEDHLRRAVALDPRHAPTSRDLAGIQSGRGRLDLALETISAAIAHGEQKELYACQGWLRIRKGDLPGAIESFRNILRLDPDCKEAHRRLAGLCHKTGESEQALAHLMKIESGR